MIDYQKFACYHQKMDFYCLHLLYDIRLIDSIITYYYRTVVRSFEYFQSRCKNDKSLVWSIDKLEIETVHVIIKSSILIGKICNIILG